MGYLWTDNWNDWFEFQTLYVLTYFDDTGVKHEFGGIKIGQFEMLDKQSRPNLPNSFEVLGDEFFSLGQDPDYYLTAQKLGDVKSSNILVALRDIVQDEELYAAALDEKVTGVSLLREVNTKTIEGQYRRILNGGAALTEFSFRYEGQEPKTDGTDPLKISFDVVPDS